MKQNRLDLLSLEIYLIQLITSQMRNHLDFTLRPQKLQTEYVTDVSEFTFKGSSQQAPTVNYFTNDSNTGFTSFAQSLVSEYQTDVSRFTFTGIDNKLLP